MSTPQSERRQWDAAAVDLASARRAIWNTDTPTEAERIDLLLDVIAPALEPVLRKGARVLDLGCGVGDLTRAMARRYPGVSFIGVDSSQSMLDLARTLPKGPGKVRFVLGDGRTLPRVGALNGAWSVVMFQHIPDSAKEGYIREVAERFEANALLCVQFVVGESTDTGDTSTAKVVRWCQDAGLAVTAVSRGVVFPTWAWLVARKAS